MSSDFALVLRLRELALALPRKDDRDELNKIADRFHAVLVGQSSDVSRIDTQYAKEKK